MIVSGWGLVAFGAVALLIVAVAAVGRAMHGLNGAAQVATAAAVIVLVATALMPVFAIHLFGDVSRILPAAAFADGSDGKDQIVVAGALWSLIGALAAAAGVVALARWLWPRRHDPAGS
jgi:hypothetical protein